MKYQIKLTTTQIRDLCSRELDKTAEVIRYIKDQATDKAFRREYEEEEGEEE